MGRLMEKGKTIHNTPKKISIKLVVLLDDDRGQDKSRQLVPVL